MESNSDAKERNYRSLQAIVGTVPTNTSPVNHDPRVSYTFRGGVFLTHPAPLHLEAFAPNLAGGKYPGEFQFSVYSGEMIFL
jgi:hypothetical protein